MGEIHVTERSTFKQCRRMWQYQYKEHLVTKTEPRSALWLGRLVHYAIAAHYRGEDGLQALNYWLNEKVPGSERRTMSYEEREDLRELSNLAFGMFDGYYLFARERDDFSEVVAVEEPINLRIPGTRGRLVGTLDLLVRRGRRLWVVDHKTLQQFASPEHLELDDQMTAYLWCVYQKYGEMPAGAIYNQLRKKLPAQPQVLKKGGLSKDKGVDTTYAIYRQAIIDNGFNLEEYGDILDALYHSNKFFNRDIIARGPNELRNFGDFLSAEYRDMTSKRTVLYPHATRDCVWMCSYRSLCRSDMEGGDTESLKEVLYEVSEERRL